MMSAGTSTWSRRAASRWASADSNVSWLRTDAITIWASAESARQISRASATIVSHTGSTDLSLPGLVAVLVNGSLQNGAFSLSLHIGQMLVPDKGCNGIFASHLAQIG